MSGLAERLMKTGSIKESAMLKTSSFFKDKDIIVTDVPIINVAFSGRLNGGFQSGLTMLAGPSKTFKTNFGLLCVSAYMKKHSDAICLFYDSEFGSSQGYWENFGIDESRVLHVPVMNIEELKFDMVQKLEEIKKGERVIILIDSIGNLASKKEVEDAKNENSAADMTRAKQLKSLFRMVTPYFTMKNFPCIAINHTYAEIALHPRQIVGGGTGGVYSSDTIFILGKRQNKEGTDILGYDFILNAEKSRSIKEKSALPVSVTYGGGIDKYSGLLDLALLTGHVIKPKNGWFTRPSVPDDKSWRRKDTSSAEFWDVLLKDQSFDDAIFKMYSLSSGSMMDADKLEALLDTADTINVDYKTGEVLEEETNPLATMIDEDTE